jgi:hypothetical protein
MSSRCDSHFCRGVDVLLPQKNRSMTDEVDEWIWKTFVQIEMVK